MLLVRRVRGRLWFLPLASRDRNRKSMGATPSAESLSKSSAHPARLEGSEFCSVFVVVWLCSVDGLVCLVILVVIGRAS